MSRLSQVFVFVTHELTRFFYVYIMGFYREKRVNLSCIEDEGRGPLISR